MQNKGKFVVIEGSDGSGKGTQLELLVDYCKNQHLSYATVDFPQYYKTFFGRWIGRFLKGEFGDPKGIPPYILTIPYAADRWQASKEMTHALTDGKLLLSNRYTGSNAVYQSARLPEKERQAFVDWEFQLEYEEFGIPKEDLVIFLYVPLAVSQKLLEQKNNRRYLGNGKTKDINESNLELMQNVEKVYLEFCAKYPHWVKIDCTKGGTMLTREEIHQKIVETLQRKKIFSK